MHQSSISNPKSTIIRLLRLAAPFAGWMALAVLLGSATVGSGIGLMAASAWIISSAALQPSIADLQVAIVGVRFFGIARGVLRYLERYVSHQVTFRLLARLRVWFYAALEPLAPARLAHYRSGDLLARCVADIETLEHFYVRVLTPPAVAVLVGLLMCLLMGAFDARLAVVLLAALLAMGAGVPILMQALSRAPGRRLVSARAELNAVLVDSVQGLADLAAFGQAAAQVERVNTLSRAMAKAQARMAGLNGLHSALGGLLASGAALAVLMVAIPLVNAGHIAGVNLAVLVLAAMASFEAVLPLPLAAQYLESTLASARRLFELIHEGHGVEYNEGVRKDRPGIDDSVSAAHLAHSASGFWPPAACLLHLGDVRFRYAQDEPLVLDGVSFELRAGQCVALVGPSGAGKSTLANVLLRFWDVEQGRITLNGRDLRDYDPDEARRWMSVVSQNTYLFNATVRDNLLIARPDAAQDELERAMRGAQLEPFIQALPQGYETWIGEQGLRLSGGERQRLAIARALLKDAPILILDEPTANLDPVTEREVMHAIRALMQGRATLLITHRLTGLENADEILVIQSGRVVQRGRHAELLAADGAYRRMVEAQDQMLASV